MSKQSVELSKTAISDLVQRADKSVVMPAALQNGTAPKEYNQSVLSASAKTSCKPSV